MIHVTVWIQILFVPEPCSGAMIVSLHQFFFFLELIIPPFYFVYFLYNYQHFIFRFCSRSINLSVCFYSSDNLSVLFSWSHSSGVLFPGAIQTGCFLRSAVSLELPSTIIILGIFYAPPCFKSFFYLVYAYFSETFFC